MPYENSERAPLNHSQFRVPMPEQPADARRHTFSEVAFGYDDRMAIEEASRCLGCKNRPCVAGCPVNVDIPEFLRLAGLRRFDEAYATVRRSNSLPAICGRVCPQESQCENLCLRGRKGEPVAIGKLERFVADWHMAREDAAAAQQPDSNPALAGTIRADAAQPPYSNPALVGAAKPIAPPASPPISAARPVVAVIGSGPASLACAGELLAHGIGVEVFEAFHVPGGVLMYGIPEFRLPKALVQREIRQLERGGAVITRNVVVGRTLNFEDLRLSGFSAIFVGSGAGLPSFLGVPGENLCGVFSANEFLTRVNLMSAYDFPRTDTPAKRFRRVAVVGGGNVAMDAARCALRLGAEEVRVAYRRTEREMPARIEEIHHALEEGISLSTLVNPVAVLGDDSGCVCGLKCVRMELGEPDASGRARPVAIPGSEFVIKTDAVIVAIGQSPNPTIRAAEPELKTQSWGGIIVDEDTCATNLPDVYAGGDAVTGAATVILAMGAGKRAGSAIAKRIRSA